MKYLLLVPFLAACAVEVEPEPETKGEPFEDSEELECGPIPDLDTCTESNVRVDENGCHSLLCDGWETNPFGQVTEEFFQVLACGGDRGIYSRVNGHEMCRDRWK